MRERLEKALAEKRDIMNECRIEEAHIQGVLEGMAMIVACIMEDHGEV